MAYSLDDRFPKPREFIDLLDPGLYQHNQKAVKSNKAPFLSKTPRKTATAATIWTHSIYNSAIPSNIPGYVSMKSKCPRFSYESFSEKDLEEFLCRCGFPSICECSTEEEKEKEIICQGNIRRRIFKEAPLHSTLGVRVSEPTKRSQGFEIMNNGSAKHILVVEGPPFYDTKVNEATAFYNGWKWSQWKSKRTIKSFKVNPGPADYSIEKIPTEYETMIEKFREYKRKKSKQLRYIEMVQRRHVIDDFPGPASYNPKMSKGTDLRNLGPKAERFSVPQHEVRPSPLTYSIKRAFDLPEATKSISHPKLSVSSAFGTTSWRFKNYFTKTPGPATYYPQFETGKFLNCSKAPFGCSAKRFKDKLETHVDNLDKDSNFKEENRKVNLNNCSPLSWMFRSRSLRTKPLIKQLNSPRPADFAQKNTNHSKSRYLQKAAPFFSSEGRFRPWNNWVPVHGKLRTPGPCQYNLEKPNCLLAVRSGPLYRTRRFVDNRYPTPAPNEYKIVGSVDKILTTHNKRLKRNIENQLRFKCKSTVEPKKLTFKEKELLLIKKTIELIDPEMSSKTSIKSKEENNNDIAPLYKKKDKLLRCFLYKQSFPHFF